MRKRAESREETRERILRATMAVHDEKGIATATMSEIAGRAGVGLTTLLRHFPTYSELVQTCGGHVWQEIRPPMPDQAADAFSEIVDLDDRLRRLFEELDAFYARAGNRLRIAGMDRERMPEIAAFFAAVEAGTAAWVAEALRLHVANPETVAVATALMGFPVWSALEQAGLSSNRLTEVRLDLVRCMLRRREA